MFDDQSSPETGTERWIHRRETFIHTMHNKMSASTTSIGIQRIASSNRSAQLTEERDSNMSEILAGAGDKTFAATGLPERIIRVWLALFTAG